MSQGGAAPDAMRDAPAESVRALLRGVVDYAGLFPPAGLDMARAVGEYSRQRASASSWMLGRFVLPAGRLDEFEDAADSVLPRHSADWWPLSALLAGDLQEDVTRIERFNARHGDARHGAALVDTVELKAFAPRDVAHAGDLLDRQFDVYMEVQVADDPDELIAALAAARAKAKVRTGGTTPDAFPAPAQVARFLARCAAHDVAFKATAGLHHPWRSEQPLTYERDAPRATMFGFLNVLLATAALLAGWSEADATLLLEERDGRSVRFRDDGVAWRGRHLPLATLKRARERMVAFGSCSFAEPVRDLEELALL